MVSKAADAAVSEDSKDILPPMCDENSLNVDRFLEKLKNRGMIVTEDMDPAQVEKYVFKWFWWRPPEVFQELYFIRRLKLHGQNHTKCIQFGRCKKIVFHRLCFLKTEY